MNTERTETLLKQNREVKLLAVSLSHRPEMWELEEQNSTASELFYIVNGEGSLFVEREARPVSRDDIVLINPKTPRSQVILNGSSLSYYVLAAEGLSPLFSEDPQSGFFLQKYTEQRELLSFCFQTLHQEMEDQPWGYQAASQSLLELILILVVRYSDFRFSIGSPGKAGVEVAAVKQYLDTHFQENLSLDLLARQVHVNKFHLSHSFKQAYGIPPIQYLIERRIQESKTLLDATDYSLSQISEIVGFSSPSYFTQIFKKNTGLTPKEYRGVEKQRTGMEFAMAAASKEEPN